VKDTVLTFKVNHLQMQIGKGMELQVPIWHSRTRKAFLIHVGSVLEVIEKKGYFKVHKDANKAFVVLSIASHLDKDVKVVTNLWAFASSIPALGVAFSGQGKCGGSVGPCLSQDKQGA
jgi:hypothetical protein